MCFSSSFYELISWALPVKLALGECQRTLSIDIKSTFVQVMAWCSQPKKWCSGTIDRNHTRFLLFFLSLYPFFYNNPYSFSPSSIDFFTKFISLLPQYSIQQSPRYHQKIDFFFFCDFISPLPIYSIQQLLPFINGFFFTNFISLLPQYSTPTFIIRLHLFLFCWLHFPSSSI